MSEGPELLFEQLLAKTPQIARGWAATSEDGASIDVRTVSPTRVAAIINCLVINYGILPTKGPSDPQIEEYWRGLNDGRSARGEKTEQIIEVTISPVG